jgi:hypothetical protein
MSPAAGDLTSGLSAAEAPKMRRAASLTACILPRWSMTTMASTAASMSA